MAVLGAFAITLYAAASGDVIASQLTELLLRDAPIYIGGQLGIFVPHIDAGASIGSDASSRFGERVTEIGNLALGTVVSTTVVISFSSVFVYLRKIVNILGLSDLQLKFARRLSASAKSAIPPGQQLSQLYPKEVQFVAPSEHRRQFPLISGAGERARIKLIIRDNALPDVGQSFRWDTIGNLLRSADIELSRSIFSICKMGSGGALDIVAYGNGSELEALFNMTDEFELGVDIRTAFARALDRNNVPEIEDIIPKARDVLLKKGSNSDILLSTVSMNDGDTMEAVLKTMRDAKLSRIMLTSLQSPQERGILGATQINQFLLGES